MPGQTITITLPDALYERIRETAEVSSRSLEEVVTQSIALSLPPLEADLPPEIRSELAAFPLLSDTELWDLATGPMDEEHQVRLEALAESQEHRPLTEEEQSTLARLMEEARQVMLRRAEAYRLLAQRGHEVFTASATRPG